MQYHPDHAGPEGEAVTKEIIRTLVRGQFNNFLNGFMSHSFNSYYEEPVPKLFDCALKAHGFGTGSWKKRGISIKKSVWSVVFS
jgi:hypothetical protein